MSITNSDGEVVAEIGEGIGDATNNVAEYTAAIEGLKRARDLGATRALATERLTHRDRPPH